MLTQYGAPARDHLGAHRSGPRKLACQSGIRHVGLPDGEAESPVIRLDPSQIPWLTVAVCEGYDALPAEQGGGAHAKVVEHSCWGEGMRTNARDVGLSHVGSIGIGGNRSRIPDWVWCIHRSVIVMEMVIDLSINR